MTEHQNIVTIAAECGLDIQSESITINESGLDFQVAFAEDRHGVEWVLRIPRRPEVYERTESEKETVDFLQQHVSFEVPKWQIHKETLIAYPKLTGVPAATIDPELQNYVWEIEHKPISQNFIDTLAEVLVDLHSISDEELASSEITTTTIPQIKQDYQERMHKVKETYGVSPDIWNRWQRWLENDELWPNHVTMIHGDLHPGHIMVDKQANVTGLIDWTEASHADPSNDFMGHHRVFGDEGLENLIEAYHNAGGHTWPYMKDHIIELNAVFPMFIAEFALASGEATYEKMAKKELGVDV